MTITFTILAASGLFLFGMKIMSEALQKAAGDELKNTLWKSQTTV
jgi:Na+/phosphate symporter